MSGTPTLDYRLYSEHSRTRHQMQFCEIVGELDGELARRRTRYPELVAKQALAQAEADHQIELLAAVIADVRHYSDDRRETPADDSHAYFAKVNCLRRELEIRRNAYPGRIAKYPLRIGDFRHGIERLEAAHDWYWNGPGLNCIGGRDAYAAEMNRRDEWMRAQDWLLPSGEVQATVAICTRLARPGRGETLRGGLASRRFRHVGPGPFELLTEGDARPRVINAAGDDLLWSPDDYRALDRALHGPRCLELADPVPASVDALAAIAAALNLASGTGERSELFAAE